MKHSFIKQIGTLALVGLLTFATSCLKNNEYYVDFSKYDASIELPLAAKSSNGIAPVALETQPGMEFRAVVNVASVNPLDEDVHVTIALDEEWLDQYNQQRESETKQAQEDYLAEDPDNSDEDEDYPEDYEPYEMLPDSIYSVDKMELVVPAGERQAYGLITLAMDKIDATRRYVLPFTIVDSDLPISNWNHLMMNIQAKNPYDGDYTNTFSGSLGAGTNKVTLNTVDGNTSETILIGVYGNEVLITVDPLTNKVTVDVPSLAPVTTDPSSSYDPETGTFELIFDMADGAYHIEQTLKRN